MKIPGTCGVYGKNVNGYSHFRLKINLRNFKVSTKELGNRIDGHSMAFPGCE
jgi:hypothetical protein